MRPGLYLGVSRLQDATNFNINYQSEKRNATTTLAPTDVKMKIEQTTAPTSVQQKKKNHNGAHIFCLFIHKLTNSAAAIVVETKTKKKTG